MHRVAVIDTVIDSRNCIVNGLNRIMYAGEAARH